MSTDDHAKPQPPTDAEVHRALDALDWAAGRAERGDNQGGAPEVSKAAFRAAAARFRPDVRARLDRVMMASDAEANATQSVTVNVTDDPADNPLDLTSGLVAYYPFDGNASDMSGNGNDGTVNGQAKGEVV